MHANDTNRNFARSSIIWTLEHFQTAMPILTVGNIEFMQVDTLNLCFRGSRIDWYCQF